MSGAAGHPADQTVLRGRDVSGALLDALRQCCDLARELGLGNHETSRVPR
jgi:hypothetical protein